VPEPRDRPIEQCARGSLRPWLLSAESYLALLFKEHYLGNARAEGHPALELPVLLVRDEEILHHGHEDVLSAQTRLQA
jgi:hypothetical protein